jgi:hypothetical protein
MIPNPICTTYESWAGPPPPTPLPSLGEGSQSHRIWQNAKRSGEGEVLMLAKEVFVKWIWYESGLGMGM